MILVDTSVWIDYFRARAPRLINLLHENAVCSHPFVVGELACGSLKDRVSTLALLTNLPQAPSASDEEVLGFINAHALMGKGIGLIDAHLLAATALGRDTKLWSHDKRLDALAYELGLGYRERLN